MFVLYDHCFPSSQNSSICTSGEGVGNTLSDVYSRAGGSLSPASSHNTLAVTLECYGHTYFSSEDDSLSIFYNMLVFNFNVSNSAPHMFIVSVSYMY